MNTKKFTIAAFGVIALVLAVAVWFLISGKVTVVWNKEATPKQAKSADRVCDYQMVGNFNSAIFYTIRGSDKEPSMDKAALNNLAGSIQKLDGYKDDPTCQTILFWVAYQNEDYAATKSAYEALKVLNYNNKFPDNNLSTSGGFSQYGDMVDSLSPDKKGREQGGGAAGGAG